MSDVIDLDAARGQRVEAETEALLSGAGLDAETVAILSRPDVDYFSISLRRTAEGWEASSLSGPYWLTATGRTPLQALTGMARGISDVIRQHRRGGS